MTGLPRVAPNSVWYTVAWRWADEARRRRRIDWVKSTTAQRAIKKLLKQLHEEYDFRDTEIIVLEAFQCEPPPEG